MMVKGNTAKLRDFLVSHGTAASVRIDYNKAETLDRALLFMLGLLEVKAC